MKCLWPLLVNLIKILNLSKLTNTDVYFRGNSITCKGDKEKLLTFCNAIKFLINKYFLTNFIEKEDIILAVKKI